MEYGFGAILVAILVFLGLDALGTRGLVLRQQKRLQALFGAPPLAVDLPDAMPFFPPGEAVYTHMRLRIKGALRFGAAKKWVPIEGKTFIRTAPFGLVHYYDASRSLFYSVKFAAYLPADGSLPKAAYFKGGFWETPLSIADDLLLFPLLFYWPALALQKDAVWEGESDQRFRLRFPFGKTEKTISMTFATTGQLTTITGEGILTRFNGRTLKGAWLAEAEWESNQSQHYPSHWRIWWLDRDTPFLIAHLKCTYQEGEANKAWW